MDTSFQKTDASDEWYTPRWILDRLGEFDLDPCAATNPPWPTARTMYDKNADGLSRRWGGRVWLNPPYSRPLVTKFLKRMTEHGNGIVLIFARTDTAVFHDLLCPHADAVLFVRGRLRFYRPDGTEGDTAGCGSALWAFGKDNADALLNSGIEGLFVNLKQNATCIRSSSLFPATDDTPAGNA